MIFISKWKCELLYISLASIVADANPPEAHTVSKPVALHRKGNSCISGAAVIQIKQPVDVNWPCSQFLRRRGRRWSGTVWRRPRPAPSEPSGSWWWGQSPEDSSLHPEALKETGHITVWSIILECLLYPAGCTGWVEFTSSGRSRCLKVGEVVNHWGVSFSFPDSLHFLVFPWAKNIPIKEFFRLKRIPTKKKKSVCLLQIILSICFILQGAPDGRVYHIRGVQMYQSQGSCLNFLAFIMFFCEPQMFV